MIRKFTFVFIALIFSALAFAQDMGQAAVDTTKSDYVMGIHPWKEDGAAVSPEKAYWSLYLNAGFNVFDGDFTSEKKHAVKAPTIGAGFMYHFNNTWGIGAEYIYRQYGVIGKNDPNTAHTLLKGQSHQADAYVTFDIFNAWRPQNRYKLFALNLIAGGGMAWIKNSAFYPNEYHVEPDGVTISLPQRYAYHTAQQTVMSDNKYRMRGVFVGGASFDFNVSRDIALGLRATYNYFTKDDIDGRTRGNNNDGVWDITAMIRWKIDASRKSHVANYRSDAVLAKACRKNPASVGAASAADDEDDYVAPRKPRRRGGHDAGQSARQINNYYYMNEGSASGARGVKDTIVLYHRDTVAIATAPLYYGADDEPQIVMTQRMIYEDRYFYAYFDPSEYVLYDQSLMTIQQVADRLKRDPELCVVITGYCDNTGTNEFNNTLGRNRANAVADELMQEHGIKSYRIKCYGKGIIRGLRSTAAYAPNRRAELQLMNTEEFEKFNEAMVPENQMVPVNKTVVVKKGEVLTSIARKYYGNSNCWVYIFEANKATIGRVSGLQAGMELDLPTLSEKQRMITANEAASRAQKFPQ